MGSIPGHIKMYSSNRNWRTESLLQFVNGSGYADRVNQEV